MNKCLKRIHIIAENAWLGDGMHEPYKCGQADHIGEHDEAPGPRVEIVEQLAHIGKAHAVAERVAHKRGTQIACPHEQIGRVAAEYIRVGELKAVLSDEHVKRHVVVEIALNNVMQVCQSKEQRRNKHRVGEA